MWDNCQFTDGRIIDKDANKEYKLYIRVNKNIDFYKRMLSLANQDFELKSLEKVKLGELEVEEQFKNDLVEEKIYILDTMVYLKKNEKTYARYLSFQFSLKNMNEDSPQKITYLINEINDEVQLLSLEMTIEPNTTKFGLIGV